MTDEEFILIRENADPLLECIIDLAYLTGLRIGDILKLKRSDIKDSELHVTTQKTDKKLVFPVTNDLEVILTRAKALPRPVLSDYLFCARNGSAMGRNTFNSKFITLKKKVGLHNQNLHFHDIRAKAATDAANQGLNAQRLLGHKNRNQTDHYIKQRQVDKVTPLSLIKKGE
jgi:integrase